MELIAVVGGHPRVMQMNYYVTSLVNILFVLLLFTLLDNNSHDTYMSLHPYSPMFSFNDECTRDAKHSSGCSKDSKS